MIQTFEFEPPGTLWLGCEFDVDFDCKALFLDSDDPKIRITKCAAVGFVVSHEYKMLSAHIENVRERRASMPDCADARLYDFTLRYRLQEKIGVGFNLGAGTGTLGWGLRPRTLRRDFSTDPICCTVPDQPAARARETAPCPAMCPELGALASAVILLGMAALHQMLDSQEAQRIYSAAIALAIMFAFIVAVQRRARWAGASRFDKAEDPMPKS